MFKNWHDGGDLGYYMETRSYKEPNCKCIQALQGGISAKIIITIL